MKADVPPDPRSALEGALRRILAALFRVLLRHGMPFTAFEDLAKRTYLEVALREFTIPGKKPSVSRAAILSGLTRKEVQRLLAEGDDGTADGADRYNRAWRVMAAWSRDRDFTDAAGRPRVLAREGGRGADFAELVRRHAGDVTARAVLDELLREGAVRRHEDGLLELVARPFLLRRSEADKLELLGGAVADLMTTIDHNIAHGEDDPWFQRRVTYHDMPASIAGEFRDLAARHGMALLRKLDDWLARKDALPVEAGEPLLRLGVGVHYFEERKGGRPTTQGERT